MTATPGLAQDDGRVTIDARRCAQIQSPDERLACFEAEVSESAKQPAAPASPGATAAAPASAAAPAAPQVETARVPQRPSVDQAATEWAGTVTSLQERLPRRYLITLDTGQVWEQKIAERYSLRVGQRVRIYSTRWGGSHRLEAEGVNGFIQVDRVR